MVTIIGHEEPGAKSRLKFKLPLSIISPIALLLIWEAAARFGLIEVKFFPAPSVIIMTGIAQMKTVEFWDDIIISLQRIVAGYVMGAIPGTILGLSMGLFRPVREIFRPLITAIFPIPKIALLPLLLIIFGIGEMSKYVVIAINVFFLMAINAFAGVVNIPQIYFDVAKNLNAKRIQIYLTVALPGALPGIFTGLRISTGTALILLVAAEFSAADSGVGYRIWWAWSVFWVDTMYVGFFVIAVLGLLFSKLVDYSERIAVPWKKN